jgi:hypothetical protein
MVSATDHLLHGAGPFNPPTNDELTRAQARIADLEARVLRQSEALAIRTGSDLEHLLASGIDVDDIEVEVENGADEIVVRISNAQVNDDDEIVGVAQEFEVEFTVEISGSLTVIASNEDEADDYVSNALDGYRWELDSIEVEEDDHVVDQRSHGVDISHRVR